MTQSRAEAVICIDGVYKIFGPDPFGGLKEIKTGKTKKDLAASNHVLALCDASTKIHRGEIFVVMGRVKTRTGGPTFHSGESQDGVMVGWGYNP